MAAATIFIDTNLFLHYHFPDQIDWPALVGASDVELVVAPVVMRELDRHKYVGHSPKLRKRAASVVERLDKYLDADSPPELRPGVTLRYEVREPQFDPDVSGLSRDSQDDQLVASVLAFRATCPNGRVLVATADIGLKHKARARQIEVVRPPDDRRLADEPDANERRVQELEKELREWRQRTPTLALGFAVGSSPARYVLPQPVVSPAEETARRLAEVRREHPHMRSPSAAPGFSAIMVALAETHGISEQAITAYNTSLDRFYWDYERYLDALAEHENLRGRTLRLSLQLRNEGTAPAEDIDVFMHFPPGCRVVEEGDLPARPAPPEPPRRLQGRFDFASRPVTGLGASFFDPPALKLPDPLQIHRKSNGDEVRFHVERLKQQLAEVIDPLYVIFDSFAGASSFGIEYRINAANLPREQPGRLDVVVIKQQGPG